MTVVELLILLLVAGVCGAIGQKIAGFSRGGYLVSIVIGFIGAMIGGWLARKFDLPEPFTVTVDSTAFPVMWSIIGSIVFVIVIGMLTGGGRGK